MLMIITLIVSVIFSFLSCALSSKSKFENDSGEFFAKNRALRHEVIISDKNEESFYMSTDAFKKKLNISSDYNSLTQILRKSVANTSYSMKATQKILGYVDKLLEKEKRETTSDVLQSRDYNDIIYISAKETNQKINRVRHKFINTSSIFENSIVPKIMRREENNAINKESKKTENTLILKEKSIIGSLNNISIKNNLSKLLSNTETNMPQNTKYLLVGSNGTQTNNSISINDISLIKKELNKNLPEITNISIKIQNVTMKSVDPKIAKRALEGRSSQENWDPVEDDFVEAANFGLQAMHALYYIQEPKLYSMGLYLGNDEPARYVAAFNNQEEEARNLARFGYAVLQSTTILLRKFPDAMRILPLSRNIRKTLLQEQCPRRGIPQCPLASLKYRTSDGSCNNLQNLWWGSAMSRMHRFLPVIYQDGVQSIRRSKNGRTLPSARDITSLIHEDKNIPLVSVTHMLMQWGQFIDHDLTATASSRGFNGTVPQCCLSRGIGFQQSKFMHPECLPIAVNLRDRFYGPLGIRCLEFLRSGPAPNEGCEFGPREQLSQVTSYLDASMVYSSNALHSDSLRLFRNGLLQYGQIQSKRPLLSRRESDLCKLGSLSTSCFRAGDGRLSEQPALTSLHIVFLRLHNRIAKELSILNSHWSDEKIFQETRKIVGAILQHITYREFLPIILGPQVMKIFDLEVLKKDYYKGYDPTINPTIANAFATAAYRFGHSLVQQGFARFDSKHRPVFNNVSIHDEFANPTNIETAGSIDRLLLGLINQPCQKSDEFITEEITNHLFQTPGFPFGMDLASVNIQRGRDHGLPPYVQWREPCGLSPIKNFNDLDRVMSPNVVRKFKSLYSSVEDIDLFPAGLAEKSVIGGLVGPTFACIIGQQFSNLRRGDRFWYENPKSESGFSANQLQQIRQITLAQILCKTIDGIETIQPFVFLTMDILKNHRLSCNNSFIGHLNLEFWIEESSEFRNNIDVSTTFASKSTKENANSRRKINHQEQEKVTVPKPFKTSINQNNRIIVKRPFGRPDNVTIMVQNNAVNSPVFVNSGIYGSHIRIQQPITKAASNFNYGIHNYPAQRPQTKPIPIITIPPPAYSQISYPYTVHTSHDINNPNPFAYRSANLTHDNIFYDDYLPTSPRPTLYTYYTNFQQQYTTNRMPNHEINSYLINYGSSHQKPSSPLLTRINERFKPSVNPEPIYELNNQQKPNSMLKSANDLKSSINLQPVIKPNYQSYEVQQLTKYSYLQKDKLNNITHENNFNNINESYYDWYLHNSQKKSSEKPYDYDHSNSYQKLPIVKLLNHSTDHKILHTFNPHQNASNITASSKNNSEPSKLNTTNYINNFMQNGPYSTSSTRIPAYQEKFDLNHLSLVNLQESVTNQSDFKRYPEVSFGSAYQKQQSTPIQYNLMSNSSYIKDIQSDFQNNTFALHNSLFNQKLTNISSTYERNNQSQFSFYSQDRPITVANQYEYDDFNKKTSISSNLTNQWLSSTYHQNSSTATSSYWLETSTNGFQVHVEEMQNVTATTEEINTVYQSVHSEYINQYTPNNETLRPVTQNTKNYMTTIAKPGQYYYEKNILRRYPDKLLIQIPKNNYHLRNESEKMSLDKIVPESIAIETSVIDSVMNNKVIQNDQNQLTTIPMSIIMHDNNKDSDIIDNFKNASSANIANAASVDVINRINHRVNSQEDLNLPSIFEMLDIAFDEFSNTKELPRPII